MSMIRIGHPFGVSETKDCESYNLLLIGAVLTSVLDVDAVVGTSRQRTSAEVVVAFRAVEVGGLYLYHTRGIVVVDKCHRQGLDVGAIQRAEEGAESWDISRWVLAGSPVPLAVGLQNIGTHIVGFKSAQFLFRSDEFPSVNVGFAYGHLWADDLFFGRKVDGVFFDNDVVGLEGQNLIAFDLMELDDGGPAIDRRSYRLIQFAVG